MRKGQVASESVCMNISVAKIKKHVGEICNTNINLQKTDRELSIPSHRKTKRFNSLDEYLSILKQTGWSYEDFDKNGYCKDQIACFNFILKGKLTITREIFIEEYCNKLIPLREIEKKYGIPYGCITFVREYFGIKRIGATGLKRGSEELPLTQRQKEIIYGGLMGDMSKFENGIKVVHCLEQKDYCYFLFNELKEHCSVTEPKLSVSYDDRFDTKSVAYSFHTRNHRMIKSICDNFYKDGRKVITKEILSNLTDFSLAIWFQDDGSSFLSNSNKVENKINFGESKIYTCSFTNEENELIKQWFDKKYLIDLTIKFKKTECKNPYLYFNVENSRKLREIIKPYTVESMMYKVNFEDKIKKYKIDNNDYNISKLPCKKTFVSLDDNKKQETVNEVFNIYRKSGFPYIVLDDESLYISFMRIVNWDKSDIFKEDRVIKMNSNSTNIIWHFQPHMFNIASKGSLTPIEIFRDDNSFKDAIFRRLTYGGSCTPSGIRAILKDYKHNKSVSNFPPMVAKGLYSYFDRDISVLDFCAGFGGRLLAAMGSQNVKRYVGIDCLKENCDGHNKMIEKFSSLSEGSFSIINSTAENTIEKINEKFDVVFTSPPYFDREIYSKTDLNQSFVKYPEYSSWLKDWLLGNVLKASKLLKEDGRIALDLSNTNEYKIEDDFIFVSRGLFKLDDILYYEMPSISYLKGNIPVKREKILIFSKI